MQVDITRFIFTSGFVDTMKIKSGRQSDVGELTILLRSDLRMRQQLPQQRLQVQRVTSCHRC